MSTSVKNSTTTPNNNNNTPALLPRDARLIALLLAANGAEDAEEGVVRMLVEFAHRYTSDILTDSLLYAEHARAANASTTTGSSSSVNQPLNPSIDDIRLAVQARTESAQVPKEFLLQLATQVNSVPLPPVPEVYGIRLPPTSQRLTAPNFSIVPRSGPPPQLPNETTTSTTDGQNGAGEGGGEGGGGGLTGVSTREGSEADGGSGGLFGDDDDDDDDDEEDEEDEEMEDVTAGMGGSGGTMSGSNPIQGGGGSANGTKRKAGESDEEYD